MKLMFVSADHVSGILLWHFK